MWKALFDLLILCFYCVYIPRVNASLAIMFARLLFQDRAGNRTKGHKFSSSQAVSLAKICKNYSGLNSLLNIL